MKKTIICGIISLAAGASCAFAQDNTITSNGIDIAYQSFGKPENPPIVLIHTAGEPMTGWPDDLCRRVADKGFRVIRFDSRDTGLSTHLDSLGTPDWAGLGAAIKSCDKAPLPYTLTDMARDVIGLMDGLNIDQAHLVGMSMGGAIAQLLTIKFPDRVRSLTIIGATSGDPDLPQATPLARQAMATPPPATTDKETLVRYLLNIYRTLGSVDDDKVLRKRVESRISRNWYPEGTARQIAANTIADNCDRRKELRKVKVPTLVIQGDVDPLVSPEAANQIASAIEGSELFIINGMGHDLSMRFVVPISDLIIRNAKKKTDEQALK